MEQPKIKQNIKETLKSYFQKGMVGLHIAVYSAFLAQSGMVIKNVYECNPQANLEQRLTRSDIKQMNHLDSLLDKAIEDTEKFNHLRAFNGYEAVGLHLSFHSYAMTNIGLTDDSKKEKSAESIDKAIEKYISEDMKTNILGEESKKLRNLEFSEKPNTCENIFYYANLNLMIGGYKLVSGDNKYDDIHSTLTKEIARSFEKSGGVNLNSFSNLSWTADNTVALASLKLYDHINETSYSENSIELWKNWIKENMLDEDGNMYSMMNGITKEPTEGARGSNLAYSIIFINMFDPEFSKKLYGSLEENFYDTLMGIQLTREWNDEGNSIDVDSGPVISGIGSVASAFAMGAAKLHNDDYHFSSASLATELSTLPFETRSSKRYWANICLGEAVLLYSRTLRPWIE